MTPVETAAQFIAKLNAWQAITIVVEAAKESGIELERALRFLSLVQMGVRAGAAKAPEGKQ